MSHHMNTGTACLLLAIAIIAAFTVCYSIPGMENIFFGITTTIFVCAGLVAISYGFVTLYQVYRERW